MGTSQSSQGPPVSSQDALGCPRAPQGAPSIIQVRPRGGNTIKSNVFLTFFNAPRVMSRVTTLSFFFLRKYSFFLRFLFVHTSFSLFCLILIRQTFLFPFLSFTCSTLPYQAERCEALSSRQKSLRKNKKCFFKNT